VTQAPAIWWQAVVTVLRELASSIPDYSPAALSVDGTSSTLLLCSRDGTPLAPALMYNDSRSREEAELIAALSPSASPARGASSSLAKLLFLKARLRPPPGTMALHQADWIVGQLTGRFGISDWNNCLKLGYDPMGEHWPDWITRLAIEPVELPSVVAPGAVVGHLTAKVARETGLPQEMLVIAGTTDSTAAVIAAGVTSAGEAVTSLGSTLVVKILAPQPITAAEYGVYSHRFGNLWLTGGASNAGGAVLRKFFSDAQIQSLTARLRPDEPTGLDYYPLPAKGERFPVNDPDLEPRLVPRPVDDTRFFQGILEGIAQIEATAYGLLESLGAPSPKTVMTIGGGSDNTGWMRLRERLLGVPVMRAATGEAAYGAARLALAREIPR